MIFSDRSPQKPLREDTASICEAMLYVMGAVPNLTQYQIVKALFLADRAHLNRYGRPITFDNYVAMEHGPVPSLAYDVLKPTHQLKFRYKFGGDVPWKSAPVPNSKARRYTPLRPPNLDHLSRSDRLALDEAVGVVKHMSFDDLRNLTHEDRAWKEAWAKSPSKNSSVPMKIALLLDNGDGERLADQLVYASEYS
jgi:uncharacterized phage-associated protein